MRLPYLQIASEVDRLADDLAAVLDWNPDSAYRGLCRLFDWALDRCPSDAPPSANDVVKGPGSAKLIARAARYPGDADAFISACETLMPPVLERTPDGIRVKGLDRYDGAWEAANVRIAKSRHAAKSRWSVNDQACSEHAPSMPQASVEHEPSIAQASAEHPKTDAQAMPRDAYIHTQTHTQIDKQLRTYVSAPPANFPVRLEKPTKPDDEWLGMDFWTWAQVRRVEVGLSAERRPNEANVNSWWSARRMEGASTKSLRLAFVAFANDDYWSSPERKPAVPFRGFMSQYERFLTLEVAHAS